MKPQSDGSRKEPAFTVEGDSVTAPRKRFHVEKIEERIAPSGHYNPQSKWVGSDNPPSGADISSVLSAVSVF